MMKTKKLLSVILAISLALSMPLFATQASAETISTVVAKTTMNQTNAESTIKSVTTLSSTASATIYHVTGTKSVRSAAGTYYFSAQKDLASPLYNDTFSDHVTRFGLSQSKQMVASSNVTCEIPATHPSGTYGVYVYWTGVKLTQKVIVKSNGSSTETQNRVISYVPCSTSAVVDATYK